MRNRQHGNSLHVLGATFLVVAMTLLFATTAFGKTVLDYDANRTSNPVADNITRLNVNKLEKGSRDYVEGAHLCIIEKETGRLVTEWITDGTTHEIARNTGDKSSLNVDEVYILRELEAPEGYAKAADTEFVLRNDNAFNTAGEIIDGPDAEFDAIQGSGDVQAFVINLYDEATVYEEDVEYRRREGKTEVGAEQIDSQVSAERKSLQSDMAALMQTGAYIACWALPVIAVSALIGLFIYRKRHDA